jgi:hypothetical protein
MTRAHTARDAGLYGYLVEFETPEQLLDAAEAVRDAGYGRWDAHTPFPLHGLDHAMGLHGTRLPWIILAGGLAGLALALLMQWWMNAVDYPFWISGKPFFGLPAAIPITFELTVLLSALTTFFAMWGLNGLPRHNHPLFSNERFRRVTQDRFFISLEAADPMFHPERTREFAESLGGVAVEAVED